jgi:hypothetical protein
MKKRSQLAKELRPYLLNTLAASAAPDVNINDIVAQVRDVIGDRFVTDVEFAVHTGNRDAHHEEAHDIVAEHTASGAPFDVVALDETAALELMPGGADPYYRAAGKKAIWLRSNDQGQLFLDALYTQFLDSPSSEDKLFVMPDLVSPAYASQTSGWRITKTGDADFRYIFANEMHVRIFYADLTRALAGIEIVAKSVAELAAIFTAPNPGSPTTVTVRDHSAMPGVALFESGDVVALQFFSRANNELILALAWGTVTNYQSGPAGSQTQRWTFTRSSGVRAGSMAAGTVVQAGAVVLDYGKSGNGYLEMNAIDGPNASNAPYFQVVRWSGHPADGKKVVVRMGNLAGLAQGGPFESGIFIAGIDNNQYLKATGTVFESRNVTHSAYFQTSTQTYQLDPDGTLRIGADISDPASTALAVLSVARSYAGATYGAGDLLIGNPTAANLLWDISAGKLLFRQASATRAFVDTDGSIKAASGRITLADNEVTLLATTAAAAPLLAFRNAAGILLGSIQPQDINGTYTLVISGTTKINSAASVTGDFSATGVSTFTRFSSWTPVAFTAGWADVGASGSSTYESCQYRKLGDMVQIRGLVKRSSGSATVIFVLPTGHRPLKRAWRTCQIYDTSYKTARVDVDTAGNVVIVDYGGATAVNYLSLDISFSIL